MNMRPLSAYSYGMLQKHKFPLWFEETSPFVKTKSAWMWHFIHTIDIDLLESLDEEQFQQRLPLHAATIPAKDLMQICDVAARQMNEMNGATVEVESDDITNFPTTATSQTSSTH